MMTAVLFVVSFIVLCAAISATYGALKFDDAKKIRSDALHTFAYFMAGIAVLGALVWYLSR